MLILTSTLKSSMLLNLLRYSWSLGSMGWFFTFAYFRKAQNFSSPYSWPTRIHKPSNIRCKHMVTHLSANKMVVYKQVSANVLSKFHPQNTRHWYDWWYAAKLKRQNKNFCLCMFFFLFVLPNYDCLTFLIVLDGLLLEVLKDVLSEPPL